MRKNIKLSRPLTCTSLTGVSFAAASLAVILGGAGVGSTIFEVGTVTAWAASADSSASDDLYIQILTEVAETDAVRHFGLDPDETLEELRDMTVDSGALCAAASLGSYTGTYDELFSYLDDYGIIDTWSFIETIPEEQLVMSVGYELYCIVPADESYSVRVSEWVISEENDYNGAPGEVLYESNTGEPVLVWGNVSDIMPNLYIEVETGDGRTAAFSPYMSLRDNTLAVPETGEVLDFTEYESGIVDGSEEGYWDDGDDYDGYEQDDYYYEGEHISDDFIIGDRPDDRLGDWTATYVYTQDDQLYDGTLTFYDEGTVEFAYGISDESYEWYYAGSWWYMDERDGDYAGTVGMELHLYGDAPEGIRAIIQGEYLIAGMDEENFFLALMAGETLFPNQYWSQISFTQAVG